MTFLRQLILAAAALAFALQAQARTPVPVVDFENIPFTGSSGQPASATQIKSAIEAAAQARGWQLAAAAPDRMVATLHVRGKHTVVSEITYRTGQYSVRYQDSVNMNFDAGTRKIHPFYNKWTQDLVDTIRTGASR